jgi:uncharacterized lipoprotein YmbA
MKKLTVVLTIIALAGCATQSPSPQYTSNYGLEEPKESPAPDSNKKEMAWWEYVAILPLLAGVGFAAYVDTKDDTSGKLIQTCDYYDRGYETIQKCRNY